MRVSIKTVQGKEYYIISLGETQLISPQEYFRMEHVGKMAVTMDMMELVFKDCIKLLV